MKKKRRLLSFLLCGTMLFSLCTQPVSAGTGGQSRDGGMAKRAEGLCEHHTRHDADCGYAEEAQGTDCTHQHTKDCYTEVTRCVYEHEANGGVSDKDSTPPMQRNRSRKKRPISAVKKAAASRKN